MSTTRLSPAKRWFHQAMRQVLARLPAQARFAMHWATLDCDPDPDLRLEVKVAETQQELEECFGILHDAYVAVLTGLLRALVNMPFVDTIKCDACCRELGWEAMRPDGLEADEYGRQLVHRLARRRSSGKLVGCSHLALTRPEQRLAPLSFEISCLDVIRHHRLDPAHLVRDDMGKTSRSAVMCCFRQGPSEQHEPASVGDRDFESRGGAPRVPPVPMCLFLGVAKIALRLNVEHVFLLTKPRLASHLARVGFRIHSIGDVIEHRGIGAPSAPSSSKVVFSLLPITQASHAVIGSAVNDDFYGYYEAVAEIRSAHLLN